jgi:hypothetical protein
LNGAATPRTPDVPPMAQSSEAYVQNLLEQLFDAEMANRPAHEITAMKQRIDYASKTLGLSNTTLPMEHTGSSFNEAGKLIRVLNNIQPKPSLGSSGRAPTPQQVEQWVKDMDTAFNYAQILDDSTTRTHWAMGTVQYTVHRELLQQRVNDGVITTWGNLKDEQRKLVQDPVLTRYDNYVRFFNFEWRDSDTVNHFLLQLGKTESVLQHSFFKMPEGDDDDELKIAFVWSKIPELYCREVQRTGVLQHLTLWEDFERALRNAETAVKPEGTRAGRNSFGNGPNKNKRGATSPRPSKGFTGKKQDRKLPYQRNNDRSSPRREGNPHKDRQQSGGNSNSGQREYHQGDHHDENHGYNGSNSRKPHWKNRNERSGDKPRNSDVDSGKEKP